MGKDFKEKYERVCADKDKLLCIIETQLNGDISQINAEEFGQVVDAAKDFAEIMEKCAKAEYYHKVTESMDSATNEEKSYYMNKYIPEYEGKFYTPIEYARTRDSRGRYMYTEPDYRVDPDYRNRMYYSSMNGSNSSQGGSHMNYTDGMRDVREGRSPMARRTYMELKEHGADKDKASKELEHYIAELGDDITELIESMDNSEKAILKQKMSQLISKI